MRYVLFLLFMLSSGCVLNQPQNFYYTSEVHNSNVSNVSSTSTITTNETPAPKPKAVTIQNPTVVIPPHPVSCAEFILPPKGPVPPTPVFSDPELKVKVDIDVILAAHIKALNQYADNERKRVVAAYRDWKETCR